MSLNQSITTTWILYVEKTSTGVWGTVRETTSEGEKDRELLEQLCFLGSVTNYVYTSTYVS